MELKVTEEVQEKLRESMSPGDRLYLDFEDGDGPFANTGLTCRLDLSFRLILTPENYPQAGLEIYDQQFDTEVGAIKVKTSTLQYLDSETILAYNGSYRSLQLRGTSGLIADNIPILRFDQQLAGTPHG